MRSRSRADRPPGLAGWLVRLLPERTGERCFLPVYYELHARHVRATARRRSPAAAGAAVVWFRIQIIAAAIECGLRGALAPGPPRAPGRRGVDPMLTQDARFAVRTLRRNPGFALVAIATLAIGIGANTAMFSVVHAVLLRPLPYARPDRLVQLNEVARGRSMTNSPPNVMDWKARSRTLAALAPYQESTMTLTGAGDPDRLPAAFVGADLLPLLGVAPAAGRVFRPEEERPGAARVVILGFDMWQQRFGGDRAMVGGGLTFDGEDYEVIGVMPRGFTFPDGVALWFPLVLDAGDLAPEQRGAHYLETIGRLADGVTDTQASAELSTIEADIARQFEQVRGHTVLAAPLLHAVVGDVRQPLMLLLGAVAFVLLIACANVSNLLLARASSRRAEIAVRSALGAGRWQIVRQLLAESTVLAVLGGAAGVVLAAWIVRALVPLLPQDLPRAAAIGLDPIVLLATTTATLAAGLLFGIVPALHASSPDLASFLKEGSRDGSSTGTRRLFRSGLVAAEVALALVLLAGAGVALRSFDRLRAIDPGFDPAGVLAATMSLPEARYSTPQSVAQFYDALVEGLAEQPGVSAAGAVMQPPLGGEGFGGTFDVIGRPEGPNQRWQVRPATPGYLETLRIPLRRGRTIAAADRREAARVAVISDEAARRFWPGEDPIGRQIRIHVSLGVREEVREIVGIVGDVKLRGLEMAPTPIVYVPQAQYASDTMTVFVRGGGDPMAMVPVVRTQVARLDREIALSRVGPADRLVARSVAQQRFRMQLLTLFAAVALTLAGIGLYGVMAFTVNQRRAELGLRVALGADRGDVLRLVLRQGLAPVAIGLCAGLLGARVLTRAMAGLLHGVSATDPLTLAAVSTLLCIVAIAACLIPARRALQVDPKLLLVNR